MSKFPSFDGRPLKGRTQFLPDVYPQQPHQLEDALTEQLVKDGFKYHKPVGDEYKSSRNIFLSRDLNSVWDLYYNIITRKAQIAPTFDPKTRQAPIKQFSGNDDDWTQLKEWLSELNNVSPNRRCSIHHVSKEKILIELTSQRFPLSLALQLINKSIVFATAPLENLKKKQKLDPTAKWTEEVLKMVDKLFVGDLSTLHQSKYNSMCTDWDYLFKLLMVLYDNDLIEHWDVLKRVISKLEHIYEDCKKMNNQTTVSHCSSKDRSLSLRFDPFSALKFVLPYFQTFGVRFTESELITRRVLYWASSAFSDLVYRCTLHSFASRSFDKPEDYVDLFQCAHHRPLLLHISSLIICLTLSCPSAAVWNNITTEGAPLYFNGSPIDSLPCSLSFLPIPPGPEAQVLRCCLIETDIAIAERSRLAEGGWRLFPTRGFTKTRQNDETNAKMFARVLDELDSQDFNTTSEVYPLDGLFKKIFLSETLDSPRSISALVIFLCKWAVSPTRAGLYRSIYVACFLEILRNTIRSSSPFSENDFSFQQCLLTFLDQHAPASPTDSSGFRSLVCLFGELIDRGLFSHDAFVRNFIARGVFDSSFHPLANNDNPGIVAAAVPATMAKPGSNIGYFSVQSEISEENDRNSVDNPDSVRSDVGAAGPASSSPDLSRHFQYLIHFPIPQDESYAHEQNQRAQILYGSSIRAQTRARDKIKKLSRELGKLFTKSAYRVDVVGGELGKRKKSRDSAGGAGLTKESRPLEDVIQTRFRSLSYYDMECVISRNMPVFFRVLSGSTAAATTASSANINDSLNESLSLLTDSNTTASPSTVPTTMTALNTSGRDPIYYPVPSSIFFFFDLIESSLNILCLLNTVVDTIERLVQIASEVQSPCMNMYLSLVWFRVVGILRAHHAVFVTQADLRKRMLNCMIEQCTRGRMDKIQCRLVIEKYFQYLTHTRLSELCEFAYPSLQRPVSDPFLHTSVESLRKNPETCRILVFNTLRFLGELRDPDRVAHIIDINIEYSIQCPELAQEWCPAIAKVTGCSGGAIPIPAASPGFASAALAPNVPLNGIPFPDDPVAWDNLTTLICALLCRHCIETNTLFEMMNNGLARGLDPNPVTLDSHSERTVRFVYHILHRFFTAESTSSQVQAQLVPPLTEVQQPTPSFHLISDPQLLTSALQRVGYTYLVDILKILMIQSNKGVLSEAGEDGGEGSTIESDNNSSEDEQDSDRDSDDGQGDSSIDQVDGYDMTDGQKNKRKRRRVHLASTSKRRRDTGVRKNSSGAGWLKRRQFLPNRIHQCTFNFLTFSQIPSDVEIRSLRLNQLAQLVLREICVTPWVRICFYRQAKVLLKQNVLFDEHLSSHQTRHLLHIIYHPYDTTWVDLVAKTDSVADAMISLISGVNIWSLHATRMELKLLRKQSATGDSALVQVAERLVTGFNEQALASLRASSISSSNNNINNSGVGAASSSGGGGGAVDHLPDGLPDIDIPESDSIWLVPSLTTEFPEKLKEHIVSKTCDVLCGIKPFWRHKNDEDQERVVMQHSILLAHPVFSSILHTCLKTVDPLERLYDQLDCFVSSVKETRDRMPENLRTRYILQECLALRLSLLGARLASAQLNADRLTRGALILTQLIGYGVTEPHSNQTLFYTCLDMLHTIVHNLAALTAPDSKHCQTLAKKVRKELAERHFTPGIEYIRPLLFTGRTGYPFISVAPLSGTPGSGNRGDGCGGSGHGSGGSGKPPGATSKLSSSFKSSGKSGGTCGSRYNTNNTGATFGGNKLTTGGGIKSFARKRGLVFTKRDRYVPWEIYDVNRRSAFLAMCGAVQVPAGLSRIEEQSTLLLSHEHPMSLRRPDEFFHKCLFNEAEQAARPSGNATVSSTVNTSSPSEKPFSLNAIRRQASQESPISGRRPPSQPQIQPQQQRLTPKPTDSHHFPAYLQQLQQQQQQHGRLQTSPPVTAATPTNLPPQQQQQVLAQQQTSIQPPKRKRNRAAQQQASQHESAILNQMFYYQSSSALAAESAAAAVASKRMTATVNKRAVGGVAAGAPPSKGPRRSAAAAGGGGGAALPSLHQHPPYDNGAAGMMAPWPRMSGAGAPLPPAPAGIPGRVPDQRNNLSVFVRSKVQLQQQQLAASANSFALGGGGMSMEEQVAQQQDARFIPASRGQLETGYPPSQPERMMMQSQTGGGGVVYPDYSHHVERRQQQQRQQQRYVGRSQSRVPDPPPYPQRVPPHLPPSSSNSSSSSSNKVVTPMMQMINAGGSQAVTMQSSHPPPPPASSNAPVYYMTPHHGE